MAGAPGLPSLATADALGWIAVIDRQAPVALEREVIAAWLADPLLAEALYGRARVASPP